MNGGDGERDSKYTFANCGDKCTVRYYYTIEIMSCCID